MKCECISGGDKNLLEDAIRDKRNQIGIEYHGLKGSKKDESTVLNLKAKLDSLDKLYQDIYYIPVCTLEDTHPFVKDR